jgi:hypothetical protein
MCRLALMVAAGVFLTTGGVGLAQGDTRQSEAEPEKEKKICRTDKATGSLTRRTRVCMTRAEWNELSARTRKGIDEMTGGASGGKMCVPNPNDPFQGCS